jgi:hypothetical protein
MVALREKKGEPLRRLTDTAFIEWVWHVLEHEAEEPFKLWDALEFAHLAGYEVVYEDDKPGTHADPELEVKVWEFHK